MLWGPMGLKLNTWELSIDKESIILHLLFISNHQNVSDRRTDIFPDDKYHTFLSSFGAAEELITEATIVCRFSQVIAEPILYIQCLPQRSSDSAVTGPVEIGPIPMRTTASTGGSKPRLYCHRSTQYIVYLCRRRHSCQRGMNTIALLCLLCSFSTWYPSHVSWG
jgi:hypothetical protein